MSYFLNRRGDGKSNPLVEQFVARKADILFCPSWKTATPQEEEHEEEDTAAGVSFTGSSKDERDKK